MKRLICLVSLILILGFPGVTIAVENDEPLDDKIATSIIAILDQLTLDDRLPAGLVFRQYSQLYSNRSDVFAYQFAVFEFLDENDAHRAMPAFEEEIVPSASYVTSLGYDIVPISVGRLGEERFGYGTKVGEIAYSAGLAYVVVRQGNYVLVSVAIGFPLFVNAGDILTVPINDMLARLPRTDGVVDSTELGAVILSLSDMPPGYQLDFELSWPESNTEEGDEDFPLI